MNVRNFWLPCLFSLTVALLLNGCGTTKQLSQGIVSEQPSSSNSEEFVRLFFAGTWFAQGKDTAAYYFFDADGTSGRTASLETGTGLGFTYQVKDSAVTFCMGAEGATVQGTLAKKDDTHFDILWADGREETMTFVSEKGSDSFQFYSNEQLCQMAIAHYVNTAGGEAPLAAADTDPEQVTIQLYQNIKDHNSTFAWYRIDRQTGVGEDVSSGEKIDLSKYKDKTQ